jgi:hypothetical protein
VKKIEGHLSTGGRTRFSWGFGSRRPFVDFPSMLALLLSGIRLMLWSLRGDFPFSFLHLWERNSHIPRRRRAERREYIATTIWEPGDFLTTWDTGFGAGNRSCSSSSFFLSSVATLHYFNTLFCEWEMGRNGNGSEHNLLSFALSISIRTDFHTKVHMGSKALAMQTVTCRGFDRSQYRISSGDARPRQLC